MIQAHPVYSTEEQLRSLDGETTMFRQAGIAVSVAIVLGVASGASAAPVREASNNSPRHTSPDGTPNGSFFYADTYDVYL
jgi:hypothetical protein